MLTVQTDELELIEGWSEDDSTRRARFNFPIFNLTGALNTAVVYFEVDPATTSACIPTAPRRSSTS